MAAVQWEVNRRQVAAGLLLAGCWPMGYGAWPNNQDACRCMRKPERCLDVVSRFLFPISRVYSHRPKWDAQVADQSPMAWQ
ncbi:hypothetical protein B0J11DRAFT_518505 [Dendryphion nanum]|uniref:Uncharacterized protein n=1 Tax=Dendryphion nanum TaxID=256645 RepID=A0A9P9IYD1_9PLEO|nr:hypothetical protein B0J11DRAFT_518505 [Dendryphion nanum]